MIEATPTRNPFYDVEKVTKKLDTPITAEDGDQITEKVDQIVYTAKTPLPDGQRDSFEVSLQIPEDAAGQTLVFPAIQTCEQGETAWTEIPAPGAAEDSVEHPAPAFEVTAADAGTEASPAADTSESADASPTATSPVSATDSDDDNGKEPMGHARPRERASATPPRTPHSPVGPGAYRHDGHGIVELAGRVSALPRPRAVARLSWRPPTTAGGVSGGSG